MEFSVFFFLLTRHVCRARVYIISEKGPTLPAPDLGAGRVGRFWMIATIALLASVQVDAEVLD